MTGTSALKQAVVLLQPDGNVMPKKQVIILRRGAFKWLPVLCANDLVHGSWWFVWGSLGCTFSAIVPLIQQYLTFYQQTDDLLPAIDFEVTWALLIVSGIFYTLGSLAFVRAFYEPPFGAPRPKALFHFYRHLCTDELLGAWLFFLGTAPSFPYVLLFFLIQPSLTYLVGSVVCLMCILGCVMFIRACYPSENEDGSKYENYLLPLCIRCLGPKGWIITHLSTDWLAGTWFFLIANAIATVMSALLLLVAIAVEGSSEQLFVWASG